MVAVQGTLERVGGGEGESAAAREDDRETRTSGTKRRWWKGKGSTRKMRGVPRKRSEGDGRPSLVGHLKFVRRSRKIRVDRQGRPGGMPVSRRNLGGSDLEGAGYVDSVRSTGRDRNRSPLPADGLPDLMWKNADGSSPSRGGDGSHPPVPPDPGAARAVRPSHPPRSTFGRSFRSTSSIGAAGHALPVASPSA